MSFYCGLLQRVVKRASTRKQMLLFHCAVAQLLFRPPRKTRRPKKQLSDRAEYFNRGIRNTSVVGLGIRRLTHILSNAGLRDKLYIARRLVPRLKYQYSYNIVQEPVYIAQGSSKVCYASYQICETMCAM